MTLVDVVSRYKEAEWLIDESAAQVAATFDWLYKLNQLLNWPRNLQVDHGREFMGAVAGEA